MHMADALLSPAVGGLMWASSAAAVAVAARRVRAQDDAVVPLMGVLGAFVFAAQMINFTIPGTGSSGHIGGGMLLAALLGPAPALIVIASVLAVQALFFADGGLLAFGANVFNLGLLPCLVAYPLVYRPIAGNGRSRPRLAIASMLGVVVGLQLGAAGVVVETVASGISSLSAPQFLTLMLPIHLAIGIAEGVATAALLLFLQRARPDLLARPILPAAPSIARPIGRLVAGLAVAAGLTGGVVSWAASTQPDGLEWAIAQVAGAEPQAPNQGVHAAAARLQTRLSWMPDYHLSEGADSAWAEPDAERSLAGVAGGALTMLLVVAAARLWRRRRF